MTDTNEEYSIILDLTQKEFKYTTTSESGVILI